MPESRQPSPVSCCRRCAVIPLTCGGTIDVLRRAADLTHEDLAALTKIPEKTIQRICAGRTSLTVPTFLRICKALKVKNVLKVFAPEDFETRGALK